MFREAMVSFPLSVSFRLVCDRQDIEQTLSLSLAIYLTMPNSIVKRYSNRNYSFIHVPIFVQCSRIWPAFYAIRESVRITVSVVDSPFDWNMGFGVTTRQGSSPPLRELVIRMCAATDEHIFRVYDRHVPWPSCLDHPIPVEEAAEKGEEE